MQRLRNKLEADTGLNWSLTHVKHNAYTLGGSSIRPRYFWVASRVPFGVEEDAPTRYPIVDDVIGDLESLTSSWNAQPYRSPPSWWSKERRSDSGLVDGHVGMTSIVTDRLAQLAREVDWYPGESLGTVTRRAMEVNGTLPDMWKAHQSRIVERDHELGYTTPTRWRANRPARVITGGALGGVIHPRLHRCITHREAARILGFPDDWLIRPLRGASGLHMTWGKGITVDCGRWIARWARRSIDGDPGDVIGVEIGERERLVDLTNAWKRRVT
jgi:site-specific DNA-cytosine methylase